MAADRIAGSVIPIVFGGATAGTVTATATGIEPLDAGATAIVIVISTAIGPGVEEGTNPS